MAGVKVNGTKWDDNIFIDAGDDTIKAGNGDDTIYAGGGNDVITGGKGNNTITLNNFINPSQGFGNDVVNLTKGENLVIDCQTYSDFKASIVGKDVVLTFSETESVTLKNFASKDVVGSKGSVKLKLKDSDELIDLRTQLDYAAGAFSSKGAYSGKYLNEVIDASSIETAFDKKGTKGVSVKAGAGEDTITGSKFNDTLYGGNDADEIYGGDGNDLIKGEKGEDALYGEVGDDKMYGGDGDDTVYGGDGNDLVYGDKGNDYIEGNAGADTIYGGDGNDEIHAAQMKNPALGYAYGNIVDDRSANKLDGGAGDDTIYSSLGADTIYGGKGNDSLEVFGANSVTYGGDGDDEITLYYNSEKTVYAEKGNDYISIEYGQVEVYGGKGDDFLESGLINNSNLYFNKGDGKDTYRYRGALEYNSGQGDGYNVSEDTLVFKNVTASDLSFEQNGDDLVISYSKNDSVTVENYYKYLNAEDLSFEDERGNKGFYCVESGKWEIYVQTKDGGKVLLSDMIKSYYGTTGSNKITTDKEIVQALAGNDKVTITGEGGSTVFAGEGKDTVQGGAGQDYILGEAGNDSLLGGAGYDVIDGGEGNDFIDGQEGESYLMGGTGNDTIIGGSDYDYVEGGEGADVIYGNGGDDYLVGNLGADTINGGDGDDCIIASTYFGATKPEGVNTVTDYQSHFLADTNAKTIDGGAGNDLIWGSDGADTINAGTGNDSVYAFGEGSVIDLGDGDDLSNLYQNTAKTLYAGAGNDTVSVEFGKATVTGGTGDDALWGGFVSDSTFKFAAGDGNDTYLYRGGQRVADYCSDTLVFENVSSADMTFTKDGEKLVITYADDSSVALDNYFKDGVDSSKWNVYIETTEGKALLSDMEGLQNLLLKLATPEGAIAGTIAGDEIVTSSANETIYGYQGDDTIEASGAGSIVYGGEGNDVITASGAISEVNGGAGDDVINTQRYTADNLVFGKGDGHDVVYQLPDLLPPAIAPTETDYIKFTDTTSVLNLTYKQVDNDLVILRNSGADSVTIKDYYAEGVERNIILVDKSGRETELSKLLATENTDFVLGSNADEAIDALAGNDTVYALEGNDTINGGDGDDRLYGQAGNDSILGGAGKDNISAGNDDDYVDGGADNDTLYGGNGNDTVYGGQGDDFIGDSNSEAGDDLFYGGEGNDQLNGGAGNDTLYGETGDDLLRGNAGDDYIYGGEGNDTIYGETNSNATTTGNDYIDGGAGNDLIYCGSGNDTVYGGDGNDDIRGYQGDNILYGGAGNDQLSGGDGNNFFSTGTGNDTVSAGAGNDTVLVGEGFTKIYDEGGDDLVKIADIDTAKVSLRDMAGNDVIEFTATDKDNVNVVFNIDTEGNTDYDGIRIIGDADLEAWKAGNSLTGGISITSDSGVVETIKTADGFQMTSTDIDVLKANVASWLTTNNFDDVATALSTGTEQQVNDLMAVFEQTNWQPVM